jgi:hypothetical protein
MDAEDPERLDDRRKDGGVDRRVLRQADRDECPVRPKVLERYPQESQIEAEGKGICQRERPRTGGSRGGRKELNPGCRRPRPRRRRWQRARRRSSAC